jgi:hypothetical protein
MYEADGSTFHFFGAALTPLRFASMFYGRAAKSCFTEGDRTGCPTSTCQRLTSSKMWRPALPGHFSGIVTLPAVICR